MEDITGLLYKGFFFTHSLHVANSFSVQQQLQKYHVVILEP
jgi:hypothetical protein